MDHLATYLNDHMAGSDGGLELIEWIEAMHAGTPWAGVAAGLKAEFADERRALEGLMDRLCVGRSRTRQAASWVSEKFARLKLLVDDPRGGAFRRFEAWEAMSVGIEGKRLLWLALSAAAGTRGDLDGPDYDALARQAEDQRRRVEEARLEAARAALGADDPARPAD